MKLLILGGTVFLGRHLVDAARARGHEVTLFNRGRHHPEIYLGVEKLRGDRDGDLSALRGRSWDAAIDTSGYIPRVVRASAELLADAVAHYTFLSSVSVYTEPASLMDERAPVGTLADEQLREAESIEPADRPTAATYGRLYGPLKARCEAEAEQAIPGRVLNVRAGLLVGPHDHSDRFTYWVDRVARGGEVLAPGRPQRPVQFVDARDAAEWIVRMIELQRVGVFNMKGPAYTLTMQMLLEACREVSRSDATFTWASEESLLRDGVIPWTQMPLWIPEDYEIHRNVGFSKALEAGLTFRALRETVRDTLEWAATRPADHEWRAGLDARREGELLARVRNGQPVRGPG